MSNKYISQRINPEILSTLDVVSEGKVVSVKTWKTLWGLVINRVNTIDAFCINMTDLVQNFQHTVEQINSTFQDFDSKYQSLKQSFAHYGDSEPTDPNVRFWVQPVRTDVDNAELVTKAQLKKSFAEFNESVVPLEYAHSSFASAIKGVCSSIGHVTIDDVSPLTHSARVVIKKQHTESKLVFDGECSSYSFSDGASKFTLKSKEKLTPSTCIDFITDQDTTHRFSFEETIILDEDFYLCVSYSDMVLHLSFYRDAELTDLIYEDDWDVQYENLETKIIRIDFMGGTHDVLITQDTEEYVDIDGNEEVVTQTATLNGNTRELLLDKPSDVVHVNFEQVGYYCDGAIVPLINGEYLENMPSISPAYWYGEYISRVDVTYTITDTELSWSGSYFINGEIIDEFFVSYRFPLSGSGDKKITGFYQVYDDCKDNPEYSDSGDHTLDVVVTVCEKPFLNIPVTVGGKNLFNINRTAGTLTSGGVNTELRKFEFDKYYNGFTRTNYCYPNYAESTIENGVITVKSKTAWYGVGIPYKVKPNTQYNFSGKVEGDELYVAMAFYDADGNYLSVQGGLLTNGLFMTPPNATTAMLSIVSQKTNGIVTATDIQIEVGTEATEYEPYIEPVTYTADTYGVVVVKSIYPSMSVTVGDTFAVVVEYNKDINKVIAKLEAAIANI